MKCPKCKSIMQIILIPYAKESEAVNHICENKNCTWYGIKRTEYKVKE